MDKKRRSRLRNQRGESVAEVLVATLLSAIALVMLASMITVTTRMVLRSKNLTVDYVSNNNLLVEKGESEKKGFVEFSTEDHIIKLTDETSYGVEDHSSAIPVVYFVNEELGGVAVTSYKLGTVGEEP